MILAAAYCRVSTDRGDQANSFASQQLYFREYIDRRPDLALYEIYADEGITGTSTKNRDQFSRMIQDACEGRFALILTKEVSRFSRNILDTISYTRRLKAAGVGVLFLNDGIYTLDPDAELRLSIMASIAQEESRKTSSRVVWGQTRQMEKGIVFGHSLLGYLVNKGRLIVNQEEAETVRQIFYQYAVEKKSAAEIAKILSENGERRWYGSTILKLLHNEKYVGDLVQKKTYTPDYLSHEKRKNQGEIPFIVIKNHHEPIISRELWDLTQKRLEQNHKQRNKTGCSERFLFSGKILCGECGSAFSARMKYRSDGSGYRRWCCTNRSGNCRVGRLLREDDAEEMLKAAIRALKINKDAIVRNTAQLATDAICTDNRNSNRIKAEISRIERKKENAIDSYLSGLISREEMLATKSRYDKSLAALRAESMDSNEASMKEQLPQIPSKLSSILNCETENELFYRNILESITVFKDRHLEVRLRDLDYVFIYE